MNVKIVAVSQPWLDHPEIKTAEDLIVYCARVSNPANQLNVETGAKLLRYCIKHGHWSVFETVSMTVEIKTSRAIAAQILRHRSFTFQEFSQRYAVATEFEDVELRAQGSTNRQGGEIVIDPELVTDLGDGMTLRTTASGVVASAVATAQKAYDQLLSAGVAKECARMVLPLCTQTTMYMTGSVRSWIHYLAQRTAPHAQKEHRLVAQEIQAIFDMVFPITAEALKEASRE